MKYLLLALTLVGYQAANAAGVGAINYIECSYTEGGKEKRPVVLLSEPEFKQDSKGNWYAPALNISLAYKNAQGAKSVVNAQLTSRSIVGSVTVITGKTSVKDGQKAVSITILPDNSSIMSVGGVIQEHMKNLTCGAVLAG